MVASKLSLKQAASTKRDGRARAESAPETAVPDAAVRPDTPDPGRPAGGPAMRRASLEIEHRFPVFLLAGLALLFCVLMFPPIGWWPLAYVALAPWLIAIGAARRARLAYFASYLLGLGYFLVNVKWLAPVTPPGYVALGIAFAVTFPVAAWPIRHLVRRRGLPAALAAPAVWAAVEFLRSQTLVGFPWFLLAHTQYRHPTFIQISDLTGAYGVSFMIAMVNGWLADLVIQPIALPEPRRARPWRLRIGSITTLLCVGSVVGYGLVRTAEAPTGPSFRVATVQHDFPSFVDPARARRTSPQMMYDSIMALVARAADEKPDLVVLPETAWPGYLNEEFIAADDAYLEQIRKRAHPNSSLRSLQEYRDWCRETREALREIARSRQVVIVTGAGSIEYRESQIPPRLEKFNSAFLFSPDPAAPAQRYDKVHLVLFGEFVPFRYSRLHSVYEWLNSLTPWGASGIEYSLSFGEQFRPFEFTVQSLGERRLRAGAPICYEDTEPYVGRRFCEPPGGGVASASGRTKGVDMLLNISNDGWFNHSAELEQHLAASVFRAVENRVSVARSVNTGGSAVIDPNGRIVARVHRTSALADGFTRIERLLTTLRDRIPQALAANASDRAARAKAQQELKAPLDEIRVEAASLGGEFTYISDRLRMSAAHALAGTPDAAAELRAQIDDDLAMLARWRKKPWTAPGYVIAETPLDGRRTFYTRFGDLFGWACAALSSLVLLDWFVRRITSRRGERPPPGTGPARRGAAVAAAGLLLALSTGCDSMMHSSLPMAERADFERRCRQLLVKAASDEEGLHRMHAVEALQDAAPNEGLAQIRRSARDSERVVRFAALMALGTLRDKGSADLFREAADASEPNVRIAGLYGLHRIGDYRRTTELARMLLTDSSAAVRANAALAIGLIGETPAVKLLRRAQDDRDDTVRLQVLESMSYLADKEAVRGLMGDAYSGVGQRMVAAMISLGLARADIAKDLFRSRLQSSQYDEVKLAAAYGLGRLSDKSGFDLAMRMLSFRSSRPADDAIDPAFQEEMRMRMLAARALQAIGDNRALGALRDAIDQPSQSEPVRIAAARAALIILRGGESDAGPVTADSAAPSRGRRPTVAARP